jgi:hypothetical protein
MAKKAKKGKRGEGPPVQLTVTHKRLLEETTVLADYLQSVEDIVHSTATADQRKALADLRSDLNAAVIVISRIRCPNPMYGIITVDANRLGDLEP